MSESISKKPIFPTIEMEISVNFGASITAFSIVALIFEITKFKALAQIIATFTRCEDMKDDKQWK